MNVIELDEDGFKELKERIQEVIDAGDESFAFRGQVLKLDYAQFVVEYIENKMKEEKTARRYEMRISLSELEIRNLLVVGEEAAKFVHARQNEEPLYADDVKTAKVTADVAISIIRELVRSSLEVQQLIAAKVNLNEHDCETCSQKNKCPIETEVKQRKEEMDHGRSKKDLH